MASLIVIGFGVSLIGYGLSMMNVVINCYFRPLRKFGFYHYRETDHYALHVINRSVYKWFWCFYG